MSRTKGWKLVWAVALAVALWQFALLGFAVSREGSVSLWSGYATSWLSRLLTSAPVIALGIVVGCLTRPQRPERRAAAVGALAALPIVLPVVFPIDALQRALVILLGGGSWEQIRAYFYGYLSLRWLANAAYLMLSLSFMLGVGAAVAGWVGANYWRRGNWAQFWRGPAGAIVKGGLVAGTVGAVLSIARWFGIVEPSIGSRSLALGVTSLPAPFWFIVVLHLSGVCSGAVITALLVSWRPRPIIGAFAGSGITLGLFSAGMIYDAWVRGSTVHATPILLVGSALFITAVTGATAGSFAGRWRDEPTE